MVICPSLRLEPTDLSKGFLCCPGATYEKTGGPQRAACLPTLPPTEPASQQSQGPPGRGRVGSPHSPPLRPQTSGKTPLTPYFSCSIPRAPYDPRDTQAAAQWWPGLPLLPHPVRPRLPGLLETQMSTSPQGSGRDLQSMLPAAIS